jgi:hypothetical protein
LYGGGKESGKFLQEEEMKKSGVFWYFLMVVAGLVFSQTNGTAPSKDDVSRAAMLLGVAEADLQDWIDNKLSAVPATIPHVTAEQLCEELNVAQPGTERAYKGKQIKVTGVVSSMGESYNTNFDKRYVLYIKPALRVFLDDSDIDRLFAINAGQTVSIIGTLTQTAAYGPIIIEHAKMLEEGETL